MDLADALREIWAGKTVETLNNGLKLKKGKDENIQILNEYSNKWTQYPVKNLIKYHQQTEFKVVKTVKLISWEEAKTALKERKTLYRHPYSNSEFHLVENKLKYKVGIEERSITWCDLDAQFVVVE